MYLNCYTNCDEIDEILNLNIKVESCFIFILKLNFEPRLICLENKFSPKKILTFYRKIFNTPRSFSKENFRYKKCIYLKKIHVHVLSYREIWVKTKQCQNWLVLIFDSFWSLKKKIFSGQQVSRNIPLSGLNLKILTFFAWNLKQKS